MKLDAALALKQEILTAILSHDARLRNEILVGVTPGANNDEASLALRVVDANQLSGTRVQQLIEKSSGEIDVRDVGRIAVERPLPTIPLRQETLRAGSSISHYSGTAGTLGFFARRTRDGCVGFVSCNHILAAVPGSKDGDEILSPGASDGGVRSRDVVGFLGADFPRLTSAGVVADCAFARLADNVSYEPSVLNMKPLLDEAELLRMPVHKIGRTTKRTSGRISAFDLDGVSIDYPFGPVRQSGLIEIESTDAHPFARPGDSGALVFTEDGHAVGLACATSPLGGAANLGLTYAIPIAIVLDALGVEFLS